jgi:YNFM family putative membrane transporter
MPRSSFAIILFATLLAFSVLYAPQPLLPVLARDLGVSAGSVSLLITVSLVPLSIAPIAYGFLLESVSAKRVLIVASLLLSATAFALAAGPSFGGFLAIRLLQGLLLPAVLTALMTYVAASAAPERLGRAMAVYVASTVLGGFAGRAVSGLVAELSGWQMSFALLGMLLLVCAGCLLGLRGDPPSRFNKVEPRAIVEVLRVPGLARAYLLIFCAFFVFAGLLNLLPFRLTALSDGAGAATIALMYTGYLMGISASLASGPLSTRLGGELRVVLLGLALLLLATLLFAVPSIPFIFANMFLFCAGMFLVHGVLPGYVNRLAPPRRGVVNGLYVAAYYAGGSLGSFLPAALLGDGAWSGHLLGFAALLVVSLLIALHSNRAS